MGIPGHAIGMMGVIVVLATAWGSVAATPSPLRTLPALPMKTPTAVPTDTPDYLVRSPSDLRPAGQYLAYGEGCDAEWLGFTCSIKAVSLDGGPPQVIARLPDGYLFPYRDGRIAFPSISPIYAGYDFARRIKVMDLELGWVFELPSPDLQECRPEDWSPDGTELAVLCYRNIINYQIGLLSVPGGWLTLLLDDREQQGLDFGYINPRWSPDGRWLAFFQQDVGRDCWEGCPDEQGMGLFVLDLTCRTEPSTCLAKTRRLPIEAAYWSYVSAWTPAGRLAIVNGNRIEVYDVEDSALTKVLPLDLPSTQIQSMAWSQDGRWIAVNLWHTPDLYILPAGGGKPVKVDTGSTAHVTDPF